MLTRPLYRSLNQPRTLFGVERKLFFSILIGAFCWLQVTHALVSSLFVSVFLWFVARRITRHDPQLLRVLITSGSFAVRYDPAIREKGESRDGIAWPIVQDAPGE